MIIRGNTVGTNMSVDRIAEKIGGTGGGGGSGSIAPMIVTIDEYTGMPTKNATEIYRHILKGGTAYFKWPFYDEEYQISSSYNANAVFFGFDSAGTPTSVHIDQEGNINSVPIPFATKKDIGDISSALDELHTYAQGLIEGGATE